MKRLNTIALVVLAVLATSTVASASDGQRPPKAQAKPWKVIRLIERVQDVTTVDEGAPGPSLGDRIVFTSDLFDHDGNKVGRDGADCVVVRIDPAQSPQEQQIVHCSIAAELSDGQLTVQGLAQGLENLFAGPGAPAATARPAGRCSPGTGSSSRRQRSRSGCSGEARQAATCCSTRALMAQSQRTAFPKLLVITGRRGS